MFTFHMIINYSKFSPHWPHRNPNYHTCSKYTLSTSFNFGPSSVSFSPSDPYLQPPPQSFLHSSQTNITLPLTNLLLKPVWLLKRAINCSSSISFWTEAMYCLLFTFISLLPLSLFITQFTFINKLLHPNLPPFNFQNSFTFSTNYPTTNSQPHYKPLSSPNSLLSSILPLF